MDISQSHSAAHSDQLREWVRIDRRGIRTADGRGQTIDDGKTENGIGSHDNRHGDPGAEPSAEREGATS